MRSVLCARPVLSWLPHSCWVNFKFFKNNCTSLTDKTLQMYWDGSDEDKTRPQAFGNYNLKSVQEIQPYSKVHFFFLSK